MTGQEEAYAMLAKLRPIVERLERGGYIGGTGSFLSWQVVASIRQAVGDRDTEIMGREIDALKAEVKRLTDRCEYQAKAVGILKAIFDRNVSIEEFLRRVNEYIGRDAT